MPGQHAIVKIGPYGGDGGTPFTIDDDKNAVKTVTVWKGTGHRWDDRDQIKAIKVKFADGKERAYGNQKGSTSYEFTFDSDEIVTSMSLWTGNRVDRIKFVTNKNNVYDHGGFGGTEHVLEVGNGTLLGFWGATDDYELISLGVWFKESSD